MKFLIKKENRWLIDNFNVFKDELLSRKILGNLHCKKILTMNLSLLNFSPYAGDLLELQAVDLPELHCLSDVIVFSTAGERT